MLPLMRLEYESKSGAIQVYWFFSHPLESIIDINARTILDNLPAGVYISDRNRKILYWNQAAERITGFPAEEVVGSIKDVDPEKLTGIGNRYRKLIEQSSITIENKRVGITVSIGATVVKKDDSRQSIVKQADGLMYECKQKGRNCLASDLDTNSK